MTNTINNAIPFVPENTIDPAAGLNISLNTIDALLQLRVLTVAANSPPGGPVNGDRHIVGTAPTGAWAGQANKLARWLDGAWGFFDARYALNAADGQFYVRSGATWSSGAGLNGASLEWATYGGTANAITLAPLVARSAYVTGDKVRFRATATNTGATTINVSSLGVKTCITVTGAALPAGYIRTDVETSATYDGTNFVVDRMTEYGTNANGIFERSATGFLKCFFTSPIVSKDIASPSYGGFKSSNEVWTYPAVFSATPVSIQAKVAGETAFGCEIAGGTTNTSANFFFLAVTSQAAANRTARLEATGRWYA